MFRLIWERTGYDLSLMLDNREWLKDFLLGCGTTDARCRLETARTVGSYLNKLFRMREKLLRSF